MRQEDYNDMMRLPGEVQTRKSADLPRCPECGERYLGNGIEPCIECALEAEASRAKEARGA